MYNFQEIQVDFEGRSPTDGDFEGIKQLLKQLFLKAQVDFSAIANQIIKNAQDYGIGSTLKQAWDEDMEEDSDDDGDDPVLGITSVINISNNLDKDFIAAIENYILTRAKSVNGDHQKILEMLRNPTGPQKAVGLLINERFINIPPAVSVPLLENLQKELKRTGIDKKVQQFNFEFFIAILKFHRKAAKEGQPAETFYSNPEEEIFSKLSQTKFEFSVAKECDSGLTGKWKEEDEQVEPFREIVVIEAEKFKNIIKNGIQQFINEGVIPEGL